MVDHESLNLDEVEESDVRCPNAEYGEKMIAAIEAAMASGDSVGGVVSCLARSVPRVRLSLSLYLSPELKFTQNFMFVISGAWFASIQ